jgi:hypothetical protein
MPTAISHTGVFRVFTGGAEHPRWSWSGRSEDGKGVAVTLWQDRFEDKGRVYRSWKIDQTGEWKSRTDLVELIDNSCMLATIWTASST